MSWYAAIVEEAGGRSYRVVEVATTLERLALRLRRGGRALDPWILRVAVAPGRPRPVAGEAYKPEWFKLGDD